MNTIIINRKKDIKLNQTGFYSYKNELEPFLRIQNTNSDLKGVIRFNNNNFEGYDGAKWDLFNSVKGEKATQERILVINLYLEMYQNH